MLSFQIVINAPYMTYEEYSRHSGLSVRTLKDWAAQGKLIMAPKDGKRETPLINVIAMTEQAAQQALKQVE
ncbi:hypothetical protein [Photobacterium sp. Hal280]|uniref:hypothetical protein n=1 Tax=Photobacterium sp. Hal280 TaxID=3035163 RepID=UPI00301D43A1